MFQLSQWKKKEKDDGREFLAFFDALVIATAIGSTATSHKIMWNKKCFIIGAREEERKWQHIEPANVQLEVIIIITSCAFVLWTFFQIEKYLVNCHRNTYHQ